jgi:hypothetical protein
MCKLTVVLLLGGAAVATAGWLLWRRRRIWRAVAALVLWLVALLCLASGAYSYWYHHRLIPDAVREALFEGVVYRREIRCAPRPMVIHVATIDLNAPGLRFLVTPASPVGGRQLGARTTSQFLREFGVQIAINGGFFHPWHARGPLDYYPRVGDPVDALGLTTSQGQRYSPPKAGLATLSITKDNRAAIGEPVDDAWSALSGGPLLVEGGEIRRRAPARAAVEAHPRTAVALDESGARMMLFVVDGRQPNYSEGITLPELAELILASGGHTALNLDGGGSSALVIEGPDGEPAVLNSPIHGRVPPGRERPVANHLGIFAGRRGGKRR